MSFGSGHTSRASHVQSITISLIQLAAFALFSPFILLKNFLLKCELEKKKFIFIFCHRTTSDTGSFSPRRHATDFC